MKIPYGISDFSLVRREGFFYADKTSFISTLENAARYAVFLRPRRFGKSTLVSMLEHYYDVGRREQFDALFQGLQIHKQPTAEQGKYLTLRLDFSSVATDGGEEALRRTFLAAVEGRVRTFLLHYREKIQALSPLYDRLFDFRDAESLMDQVFGIAAASGLSVYLLIDEYDHFANRLLASRQEKLYEAIVTKTGFVRTFYAGLKAATGTGAIARMFVTGVSPLLLDDLSSGFNIATHVSLDPGLAAAAGFTKEETESALEQFLTSRPELAKIPGLADRAALFDVLEKHYNGYRFAEAAKERLFNSDMVLYFFQHLERRGVFPMNMLDQNVRIEYSHLQRIGTLSGASITERRTTLENILSDRSVRSVLVERFGMKELSSKAPFISLLYFMGLLTLRDTPQSPMGYELEIPNRVIRELIWEHLSLMLEDDLQVDVHGDELRAALTAMVEEGTIGAFLDILHKNVLQVLSVRDTRGLNEKAVKLLFMTYASFGHVFYPLSEKEFAQGYGDLFLGANRHFSTARFSWLLEFKYLKTGASPAQVEAAFDEAQTQVQRYLSDNALLPLLVGKQGELRAGMLVFVGAQKALFRPLGEGVAHESMGRLPTKKASAKKVTAGRSTGRKTPRAKSNEGKRGRGKN